MKLSVALCTHNGEAFLADQLASIAAQARPPDELVVVDDASTDATGRILEDFAARAAFPVRVSVGPHVGASANFGRAVARCTGDLIALCDQDDRWMPDRLAAAVQALDREPEAMLAFSDADLIGASGTRLNRRLWRSIGLSRRELDALRRDPLAALLRRPVVTGCTVTFRRSLLDLGLPFPAEGPVLHDRWLSLCAAATGRVTPISTPLVAYRVHDAQHTGLGASSGQLAGGRRWVFGPKLGNLRRRDDGGLLAIRDQSRLLRSRLEARGSGLGIDAADDTARTLEECAAFAEFRASLPGRAARPAAILSHLRAGHYERFATGWIGAGADLVRGGQSLDRSIS